MSLHTVGQLGVSFSPSRSSQREAGTGRSTPLQRAIQVLSLRLPEVISGRSIAPGPLLQGGAAPGSRVNAVLASLLQQMAAAPGVAPTPSPQVPAPVAARPAPPPRFPVAPRVAPTPLRPQAPSLGAAPTAVSPIARQAQDSPGVLAGQAQALFRQPPPQPDITFFRGPQRGPPLETRVPPIATNPPLLQTAPSGPPAPVGPDPMLVMADILRSLGGFGNA
jgi:hypothetical protein